VSRDEEVGASTKTCKSCGVEKPLNKFYKQRRSLYNVAAICKLCAQTQKKIYRSKNKDRIKERNKAYRIKNKEKIRIHQKAYDAKYKDRRAIRQRKRRQTDPILKLNETIRKQIGKSLKNGKGGKSWLKLVPYTLDDLIGRLKKTLPKGYTWDDYLKKNVLHLDHIIPISVHNFESYTDTDFQRCWALKNLQLLPAKENMEKGAKLTKHFQPSLLI
jgi:hypothetical protein